MRYAFTDKEIKELLKNLTILIDTREQKNHIQQWLTSKKIKTKSKKLDYGDYSCFIPPVEGITDRPLFFDRDIVIERKKDIDELVNNLKDNASRIKVEFAHLNMYGTKYYIFLEDQLYDKHLENGNYRSQYKSDTLQARLISLQCEYNTIIRPINKEYIAKNIYLYMYYEVRNILMRKGLKEGNFNDNSRNGI